jgi:5-formyltetrahydrofolate cyclo-ligase
MKELNVPTGLPLQPVNIDFKNGDCYVPVDLDTDDTVPVNQEIGKLKTGIRARMYEALATQSEAERAAKSGRIFRHLLTLPEWSEASVVHCHLATKTEVQTAQIIQQAWDAGRRVVVPIIDPPGLAEMTPKTVCTPGPFGILQPVSRVLVAAEDVDLWIVPGLAFCREGGRLGRGGGFYDRLLARARGHTVGLAFQFQMVESLPRDPWDRPVDRIVTECGVIPCGAKQNA